MFNKKKSDVYYWSNLLKKYSVKTELINKLIWYEKLVEISKKAGNIEKQAYYLQLILSEIEQYRKEYESYTDN